MIRQSDNCSMYKIGKAFVCEWLVQSLLFGGLVSVLFYNSAFGMASILLYGPLFWKQKQEERVQKLKKQMKSEFREVMVLVSGNLNAGYSLENAFMETQKKHGNNYVLIKRELNRITAGLSCQIRIEKLLKEIGIRWDIEEIKDFSGLLEIAKRYGGNIPQLIRQMTMQLAQVEETELEIETMVSAKKLEGRIMLCVPFAILGMLRFMNPEYIEGIYTTGLGRCWMSICLIFIILCAGWMKRIIKKITDDL